MCATSILSRNASTTTIGIICVGFSEGEFFATNTTQISMYRNILDKYFMQYEKKRFSQGKRKKNCTIFINFFLLCENMYIFYEKEVVLRAYVYSSDFINRSQITGAHIQKIWIKKQKENCLRLQFFITQKKSSS